MWTGTKTGNLSGAKTTLGNHGPFVMEQASSMAMASLKFLFYTFSVIFHNKTCSFAKLWYSVFENGNLQILGQLLKQITELEKFIVPFHL